ncbi:hypothetical protein M3Y98_01024600 [Aphelenchoides besseyi]|nr:hypothetical protein M3Y98_01024600 [Aphelenchoides besseyi]
MTDATVIFLLKFSLGVILLNHLTAFVYFYEIIVGNEVGDPDEVVSWTKESIASDVSEESAASNSSKETVVSNASEKTLNCEAL